MTEKTPQQQVYDQLFAAWLRHIRACHGLNKRHHQMHFHHGMYEALMEAMNCLMTQFPELIEYSKNLPPADPCQCEYCKRKRSLGNENKTGVT